MKELLQEFNSLPKKYKALIGLLGLSVAYLSASIWLGFHMIPAHPYVESMQQRADLHIPLYIKYIQLSPKELKEKVYGYAINDHEILTAALILEVEAWNFYIQQQYQVYMKE